MGKGDETMKLDYQYTNQSKGSPSTQTSLFESVGFWSSLDNLSN
jgi:hypothetical protein